MSQTTRDRPHDDVVIVGGGIGGLSNALALARHGLRVRVLERATAITEIGAGLQLAPNATRVLREWGLLDRVEAAGVTPRRLVMKDAIDGEELTHLDLGAEFVDRYAAPYLVIHRNDLLDVLLEECLARGVDVVVDCPVDGVDEESDHVVVRAGDRRFSAAAVLGADGLRSQLRRMLSADEPICSGYVAYRGAFPLTDPAALPRGMDPHEVAVHVGPGCHLVQYALRGGQYLNTVAVFRSPAFERGDDEWGGPEELDLAFSGASPEVREGVRSLWRDRRWPMYDRLPLEGWSTGRMTLTGDAAHPMLQYLAQGACQAIQDADVLHRLVGDGGDWPEIFVAFDRARAAATARVQSSARIWGEMWHVDGVARLLRNELFRSRRPDDYRYVDWLYGQDGTHLDLPGTGGVAG